MCRVFNDRRDEIRNSDMKDTKPTFMHPLLGKKQTIIL